MVLLSSWWVHFGFCRAIPLFYNLIRLTLQWVTFSNRPSSRISASSFPPASLAHSNCWLGWQRREREFGGFLETAFRVGME